MDDKTFIKEKIVGRKESWRKRLRHYLRVTLSALLFGAVSAAIFVLLVPRIGNIANTHESERVQLQTEESVDAETEPVVQTVEATVETEPIEDLVQSELENYRFSLSDYESMMQDLSKISGNAERSLVEVVRSVSSQDFLGGETSSEDSYSGIILAITENEVLVFTMADAVQSGAALEVGFLRGNRYEAGVKAVDSLDNFAVLSVPVKGILDKDRALIRPIPFGNSKALKRGDILMAIGAPAGELYSSSMGRVSYLSYNRPAIDSTIEDIRADMHAAAAKGSFVLNSSGELVGWVSKSLNETAAGFCNIAGVSDFLGRLELLSNGQRVPYIGVEIQDVTGKMERQGIPSGAYVLGSSAGSPAYISGIQAGDIIVSLNGERILTADSFETKLENTAVDDTIELTVQRARGQEYAELSFSVTAGGR